MRWFLIFALLFTVTFTFSSSAEQDAHEKGHWSYEGDTGPAHWAELDPAYALAADGKSQSPVDLGSAVAGEAGSIEFHYAESGFQVVNNGHTIQVNVEEGSWFSLDGKRYDLKQFHFHAPSEHAIDGVLSDMEVHCVHQNAEGKLAVVGFFVGAGEAAPNLGKVFEHAPEAGEKVTIPDLRRDLSVILPENLGHFYHYSGSLTTPPCTEGVEWIVMQTPRTASPEQIETYRKHYSGNNRPVQALNGRVITAE